MGFLAGKRAIVIGASGGIGRACVQSLLREGAIVAGSYRQPKEELFAWAAENDRLKLFPMDLTRSDDIAACMKAAIDALGGVDILIHAAGISEGALLHSAKPEHWKTLIDVNLTAAFSVMQSVILPFMRAGGGSIVQVSSVYGERGGAGQSAYCASKAGLLGLTRALAVELATKKIRVNAVAPGFVDTDMTGNLSTQQRAKFENRIPMKRFGTPEEIAEICTFLGSDRASYLTGQVLSVDGGLSAS